MWRPRFPSSSSNSSLKINDYHSYQDNHNFDKMALEIDTTLNNLGLRDMPDLVSLLFCIKLFVFKFYFNVCLFIFRWGNGYVLILIKEIY